MELEERIFRKALASTKPRGVFMVADAFEQQGQFTRARQLREHAVRMSNVGFGGSTVTVGDVQVKLNALGAQPPLTPDGVAGPKTTQAVLAFQSANGLTADGKVGPLTLAALGFNGASAMVPGLPSGAQGNTATQVGTGSLVSALAQQFADLVAFAQKYGQTVVQGVGIAPGFQATHASVVNSFVPWSSPLEGWTDFPYTDAHGLITTGMGNLIDSVQPGQVLNQGGGGNVGAGTGVPAGSPTPTAQALALPWQGGDISADWAALKAAWPGVSSVASKGITSARLPKEAVDQLVQGKMAGNEKDLVTHLPGYADAPADAQLAAHSMSWAMGTGFAQTWTNFRNAFANKDYVTAANESNMKGVGIDMRNKANKLLLLNAANVTKKNLDKDRLYYLDGLNIVEAAAIGLGSVLMIVGGVILFVYRKQLFGV